MKIKDFIPVDVKGALGTVLLVTGTVSVALNALGKEQAATAVQACGETVNQLDVAGSVQVCKEAGKLAAQAGKELVSTAVAAPMALLGGILNLFGKFGRKKR